MSNWKLKQILVTRHQSSWLAAFITWGKFFLRSGSTYASSHHHCPYLLLLLPSWEVAPPKSLRPLLLKQLSRKSLWWTSTSAAKFESTVVVHSTAMHFNCPSLQPFLQCFQILHPVPAPKPPFELLETISSLARITDYVHSQLLLMLIHNARKYENMPEFHTYLFLATV